MNCPQCGHAFETDVAFGMIECPKCKHSFFPDLNPSVTAQPEEDLKTSVQIDNAEIDVIPQVTPDLSEVADFGNTRLESTGSGGLFYNIEISGIDSPERKLELEDALRDKKLEMPVVEFLNKIKNGVLSLQQVHPVKAAVIIAKLKDTPLKIKWSTDQMIRAIKTFLLVVVAIALFAPVNLIADEWDKIEANLKGYSIKINNIQDEIRELVKKKNNLPNDAENQKRKATYLNDIKKKYSELKQVHKDLIHDMERVRFEYPEKGNFVERRYKHLKVKTMEDLEKDSSLEGDMMRVKRKAQEKYQNN